jgi:sugar phosphate isomerase/epimerase
MPRIFRSITKGCTTTGSSLSEWNGKVPRLPGLGEVDWRVFFSALYRVGYDYVVSIEHEDRGFEGTDELVKRGFLIARDVLEPFVK